MASFQICCRKALISFTVFLAAFVYSFGSTRVTNAPVIESDGEVQLTAKQWTNESVRREIELDLRTSEELTTKAYHDAAAQYLLRAAQLQLIAGERFATIAVLNRILGMRQRLSPLNVVRTLTTYSGVLIENGEPEKCEALIEDARQAANRTDNPLARGYVLQAAGRLKEEVGEYSSAETDLLAAVEIFRAADNELQLARTLTYLAGVRMPLGKSIKGLANAEEAKGIFLKTGDLRGVAISQVLVGHLLNLQGKKQEAVDEYLNAERKFPEGLDRIEKARLENGVGWVYQDLGELRLALEKRHEALVLFEQEKYWSAAAVTLAPLIDLSFQLGDKSAAFSYLSRSEENAKLTKSTFGLAIARARVGDYYFSIKDNAQATFYYNKSLPLFIKARLMIEVAGIYDKLGVIQARKGQTKLARSYFERSLAISRQIHDNLGEANTLFNLAGLEADEGRTFDALKLSQASIEAAETLSASVRNSKLRSSHFATICNRYDLYIRLLMRAAKETSDPAYTIRALQAAERARSRRMLRDMEFSGANVTADAEADLITQERELLDLFRTAADNLTNRLSEKANAAEIEKLDAEVNRLQHDLEDVRAEIRQRSPLYSSIKDPAPFDISDFQQNVLDDRSVLLEFWLGEKESYLWAVDKNKITTHVLPGRTEIDGQVDSLISLLRNSEPQPDESIEKYHERVAVAEEQYWPSARKLSDLLLGDAADQIAGKRLIIVADGGLHRFPFAALPLPGTDGNEPLLTTNEAVFEPSAQMLSVIAKRSINSDAVSRRDLAVFSDPVFSTDDERLAGFQGSSSTKSAAASTFRFVDSLGSLTRLPGSGLETKAIEKAVSVSSTDLFEGFAATREKFLNSSLDNYKILHLATHGIFNKERPDLSGIVFSRYDENGTQLTELVRLQDIYALHLDTDLVVLSACNTGSGKLVRGEGVLSLNNAFLQAGSRSVLSTLWKIDDEATRILMSHFYEGIAKYGLTPSASLRKARLALRENPRFSSPFYWAAFTLHGDPNVKPEISPPHRSWAFATVGLCTLLPGLILFYRRNRRRSPARS